MVVIVVVIVAFIVVVVVFVVVVVVVVKPKKEKSTVITFETVKTITPLNFETNLKCAKTVVCKYRNRLYQPY